MGKPVCEQCGRSLPMTGAIRIRDTSLAGGVARWRCLECDSRITRRLSDEECHYVAVCRDDHMLWRLCLDVRTPALEGAAGVDALGALPTVGRLDWVPVGPCPCGRQSRPGDLAAQRDPRAAEPADGAAEPDADGYDYPDPAANCDSVAVPANHDDRAWFADSRRADGAGRGSWGDDDDEQGRLEDPDEPWTSAVVITLAAALVLYVICLFLTGVIQ